MNLIQLPSIVFRDVFIIVCLRKTFDNIDICVLCVWDDSIKVIYYIIIISFNFYFIYFVYFLFFNILI